jgi:hypothetical protein
MENPLEDKNLIPQRNGVGGIISLVIDNSSEKILKDFHCSACGRIVLQYYGELRIIIVNELREVQRPIDIQCSRCKKMYRIV